MSTSNDHERTDNERKPKRWNKTMVALSIIIVIQMLALVTVSVYSFRGRNGPPEDIDPPVPYRKMGKILEKILGKPTKEKEEKEKVIDNSIIPIKPLPETTPSGCPKALKFGKGPPAKCKGPRDPLKKPVSQMEKWFTKDMFEDLFPFANLGWGPDRCFPYSYEAFVIAARYFPNFGTSSPNKVYSPEENHKRDLAAFFAHAVQETGENNAALYNYVFFGTNDKEAADCFYRGGFYNWFEGGPTSSFLDPKSPGYDPKDGESCMKGGRYCAESAELNHFFGCLKEEVDNSTETFTGCYFGRGAIQISYNYNYGMFMNWLASQGVIVDLLSYPNLVMTKMDPPLAVMSSLWFYMTAQPPKPAMHDIVLGAWNSGEENEEAGYSGPIFGPTSLVINNECNGEDAHNPGGPGESRRIKAFKWFCEYFNVPTGEDRLLTCKDMPVKLDMIKQNMSYQPDWSTTWKEQPCTCAPALYGGMIPYFDPSFYPDRFVALNEANKALCESSIYANPAMYTLDPKTSPCLRVKKKKP